MKDKKKDYEKLLRNIISLEILKTNKAEALIYGLQEIKDSIEIIYNEILPKLFDDKLNKEQLLELLWDLREEFRHIDYHIKDAEILDM